MSEATRAAEIEAIRGAYAALNRGDIAGFMAIFSPDVERIEPADFPQGGTYRGVEAVTEHVRKGRGTWAEGSCEPERFFIAGDVIVARIQVRVRLKHETEWRTGQVADAFRFRGGKSTLFRTFAHEREALEWAGIAANESA